MANEQSLPIRAGDATGSSQKLLREMAAWMEHATIALAGTHGLNVTHMRQTTYHLMEIRKLLGTTSREEPDDRESKWPEGESA